MSRGEKHHFVPQFLLRRWADSRGYIKVWKRVSHTGEVTVRRWKAAQFGYVRGLYELRKVDEKLAGLVEKEILSNRIESRAARILNSMLGGRIDKISPRDRADWSAFLTSFRFRHPIFISYLRERTASVIADAVAKAKADNDDFLRNVAPGEELAWIDSVQPGYLDNIHLVQFVHSIQSRDLNYPLLQMDWKVFDISRASYTLLLGDRPFISIKDPEMPPCVAMPISPVHLFVGCAPHSSAQLASASHRTIVRASNRAILKAAHGFVCGEAAESFVGKNFASNSQPWTLQSPK